MKLFGWYEDHVVPQCDFTPYIHTQIQKKTYILIVIISYFESEQPKVNSTLIHEFHWFIAVSRKNCSYKKKELDRSPDPYVFLQRTVLCETEAFLRQSNREIRSTVWTSFQYQFTKCNVSFYISIISFWMDELKDFLLIFKHSVNILFSQQSHSLRFGIGFDMERKTPNQILRFL